MGYEERGEFSKAQQMTSIGLVHCRSARGIWRCSLQESTQSQSRLRKVGRSYASPPWLICRGCNGHGRRPSGQYSLCGICPGHRHPLCLFLVPSMRAMAGTALAMRSRLGSCKSSLSLPLFFSSRKLTFHWYPSFMSA